MSDIPKSVRTPSRKIVSGDRMFIKTTFSVIQHSIPALELELSWFPTYMKPEELRRLHRPYLKPMRTGPHSEPVFKPVYSLERYVRRKESVSYNFHGV